MFPRLLPFDGTPDELNDDLDIYRTQPYEFWIAKVGDSHRFDVYYYEASVGLFIPSDIGEGPINLVSQLVDKDYGLASADIENKTNDSLNTLLSMPVWLSSERKPLCTGISMIVCTL